MKTFTVYFEIYGKKLKTTVMALSEDRAKDIVRNKIIFHKMEEVKEKDTNPFSDKNFKDFIDILGKIK